MIKIISYKKFLEWAYTMEGYIFYRQLEPGNGISDYEIKQVCPNRRVRELIATF